MREDEQVVGQVKQVEVVPQPRQPGVMVSGEDGFVGLPNDQPRVSCALAQIQQQSRCQ